MSSSLLLAVLLTLFLINMPIAIAIALSSIMLIGFFSDFDLMVVIQRMFGGADSFHLMAVPLFMYAGLLMEKGGISRRLVDFANSLVGWLPGGLAAVTIVSAMFFAGISGSAAADTAAVGALLIPAMRILQQGQAARTVRGDRLGVEALRVFPGEGPASSAVGADGHQLAGEFTRREADVKAEFVGGHVFRAVMISAPAATNTLGVVGAQIRHE